MSVECYDLAQRLRAARDGRPVPRMVYAPAAPPASPVAVTTTPDTGEAGGLRVRAATADTCATAEGNTALAALAAVGVSPAAADHRTLVVPDQGTMHALAALARDTPPGSAHAAQAAVVAWWDQRVDHPGSGAVLPVLPTCAARWVLGVAPDAERDAALWARWLGTSPTDPADPSGLLSLAERVTGGDPLPGLDTVRTADEQSWDYHRQRLDRGWDWRRQDDPAEAALGLATRADAAELYDSLLLADPLQALRARHGGTVVTGTVADCPPRGPVRIDSSQPVCRLRPDTEVAFWTGGPLDVPRPDATHHPPVEGTLRSVTVSPVGGLSLNVSVPQTRRGGPTVGQTVTLRPTPAHPGQQRRGRHNLRRSYYAAENWLARRPDPTPRRREVPLDVVVAAADDD